METFKKSRAHRDRRTREDYSSCLKTFVAAGYGHLRIDEVQSKHISEFLDSRPVGQTTKRKYFVALRAFFYLACSKTVFGQKWLETNPVKELPSPAATTPRRVIYTLQEIKDLIQVSAVIGCVPIVILRLFTMLRADEATRFLSTEEIVKVGDTERVRTRDPWDDIDLPNLVLRYHEPTDDRYSRDISPSRCCAYQALRRPTRARMELCLGSDRRGRSIRFVSFAGANWRR